MTYILTTGVAVVAIADKTDKTVYWAVDRETGYPYWSPFPNICYAESSIDGLKREWNSLITQYPKNSEHYMLRGVKHIQMVSLELNVTDHVLLQSELDEKNAKESLRKSALAKLTPEERAALDLE